MRFVSVGHLCRDIVPSGDMLGGSAAYAGVTARHLGAEMTLITSFAPDFDPALPDDIQICRAPSQCTTTFENRYDQDGRRTQRLHSRAAPLTKNALPTDIGKPDILYLCPLADEVAPCVLEAVRGKLTGAAPQGWLRAWDENGVVRAKRMEHAERILPQLDALILSEEDIAPFPDELEQFRALTPLIVLTQGKRGAVLYEKGRAESFPPYPAQELDPTGAGDVFAAAFLIHYIKTGRAGEAVDFANCAASFAVETIGPMGAPTIKQIRERRKER